ncbi:unnamed protein product [Euphydryas editha]|uniref:Kinase D-interacting substrate of 220 kDa-like SAM domain-containing protein n=1 Tax=Euphydryas editha TaxID=104508 RepID=A0AAU9THM3_EUPED|nr:unnamed protein product [Euphydryas editha]
MGLPPAGHGATYAVPVVCLVRAGEGARRVILVGEGPTLPRCLPGRQGVRSGRLLKAFQIEFNWYQLASWVNMTEQWPYRTSWIVYHHETYEEHIDDSTSLKHIYEKVRPMIYGLREASTLMELDRDERKLEVFLSFHRATLTAADLKIFLPFTINLDPYIKKVIKEEQVQAGAEENIGAGGAAVVPRGPNSRQPHSKSFHKKQKVPPPPQGTTPSAVSAPTPPQPLWVGWSSPYVPPAQPYAQTQPDYAVPAQVLPAVAVNPTVLLRTAFPGLGDVSSLRLSALSVERVYGVVRAALGAGGAAAAAALQAHRVCGLVLAVCRLNDLKPAHRVCGLVLAVCRLNDLKPILDLPFGDWELFKMLIMNLRELEASIPINAPTVAVIADKTIETETDVIKPRPVLEHQRSRPTNVEKQVTLEEQMICGALQTLNEEAMEDVLQSETASPTPTSPQVPPAPPAPSGEALRTIRELPPAPPPRALSPSDLSSTASTASNTETSSEEGEQRPDHVIVNLSDDFHYPEISTTSLRGSASSTLRRRRVPVPSDEPLFSDEVRERAPTVSFSVESEEPPARPRPRRAPLRPRPSSLRLADEARAARPPARSLSVEGSARSGSPGLDLRPRGLRRPDVPRAAGSAERLALLRDLLVAHAPSRDRSPPRDEPASDDESAPLVSSPPSAAASPPSPRRAPAGGECGSPRAAPASADLSPPSDSESPRCSAANFDLLPEGKGGGRAARARPGGEPSERDAAEPYGMRLLAHGTAEGLRALWRQDALDSDPPWLEPDSAV